MKKCTKCLENKPKSEFHKNAARKDGLIGHCKECVSQAAKERYKKNPERYNKNAAAWREKNPDKLKEYEKRKRPQRYGITIEDYNDLLDQQNNRCAICREEDKIGRALSIDHDHSCCPGKNSCGKCVRQLLCSSCNWMLGNAKDNPALLRQAAEYIENHRQ